MRESVLAEGGTYLNLLIAVMIIFFLKKIRDKNFQNFTKTFIVSAYFCGVVMLHIYFNFITCINKYFSLFKNFSFIIII